MPTALRLLPTRLPRVPALSRWLREMPRHLWPALMVALFGLIVLAFEIAGAAEILPGTGSASRRDVAAQASPVPGSGPATPAQVATLPPPEPEPLEFRSMSAEQAKLFNATVAEAVLPNPAARQFLLPRTDALAFNRALDCLAAAVYYEAGFESVGGQQAVAQVVLNRLRHPAYPKTVCGVVFQGQERSTGCQFTFTCDGALASTPAADRWARARAIASQALAGYVHKPVGWSTHYHADYVVPYWAPSLDKAETVGAHIFYRWKGGWGRPYAFAGRWAGLEPEIPNLAPLSPAHQSTLGADETVVAEAGTEALPPELQALAEGVPADAAAAAAAEGAAEPTKAEREAAVRFRLSVKAPAPEVKPTEIADASGRVSSDALKWAMSGSGAPAEPALGRKTAERCKVVAGPPATAKDKALPVVRCESGAAAPGGAGSR